MPSSILLQCSQKTKWPNVSFARSNFLKSNSPNTKQSVQRELSIVNIANKIFHTQIILPMRKLKKSKPGPAKNAGS